MSVFNYQFKDKKLNELWDCYLKEYQKGLREKASFMLKEFLNRIQAQEEEKEPFAFFLCNEVFENENPFTLQYPIKKQLIFPYLVKKFDEDAMPEIRWLYQLKLFNETMKFLAKEDYSQMLLQKAVKIDPQDLKSKELLIEYYLDLLEYATHHLPLNLVLEPATCTQSIRHIQNIIDKDKRMDLKYSAQLEYYINELIKYKKNSRFL